MFFGRCPRQDGLSSNLSTVFFLSGATPVSIRQDVEHLLAAAVAHMAVALHGEALSENQLGWLGWLHWLGFLSFAETNISVLQGIYR